MSVPAAERLYEQHRPPGWPETLREAGKWHAVVKGWVEGTDDQRNAWWRLSHGERAFVTLALSLWGAPSVEVFLFHDLGALDDEHRRAAVEAMAEACGVAL